MGAVAFFPWLAVHDYSEVGPLRLIPYERGVSPGDMPSIKRVDLDNVLNAYRGQSRFAAVQRAVLVEWAEWQSGMPIDGFNEGFLLAQEALSFAALATRKLFVGHGSDVNFSAYELVVQRFTPGDAHGFAFAVRRRDGATLSYWTSDEYKFFRPHHVPAAAMLQFESDLLEALLVLPTSIERSFREAVREFNAANSDGPNMPQHLELVMMKSAFEWLLSIDEKATSFVRALEERLSGIPVRGHAESSEAGWKIRWQGHTRPLIAWAREFCAIRGLSAHGKRGGVAGFVWSIEAHLAFASFLFPLLAKKFLSDHGVMVISRRDSARLSYIDDYIGPDPYLWQRPRYEAGTRGHRVPVPEHPWGAVESRARWSGIDA